MDDKRYKIAIFLHEMIPGGNIEDIKKFLIDQDLVDDERYFNNNMESAAAVALKNGRFDVYDLLSSSGIFLGHHENIQELVGRHTERKELLDIHRKHFEEANLKHLNQLISQCRLHAASKSNRKAYSEFITAAFEELNSMKSIEPILKVASISAKLEIVFDFNRDSVEYLDPTKSSYVSGVVYPNTAQLYIGAKGLVEEGKNRREVLGVLSHELCHFAMSLLYNNSCKPFTEDSEKNEEFKDILTTTREMKSAEDYIRIVYDYHPADQQAELIVRVPHLTALYDDNKEKIEELSETYNELFQFYEKNTKEDLEREYPLMKSRKELIDLYSKFKTLHNLDIDLRLEGLNIDLNTNCNFLLVSSNCCQLTICAINKKCSTEMELGSIILADLKAFQNNEIFNHAVNAIRLCAKPKLIIDCSGQGACDVEKIVQKFRKNHIEDGIVFVFDQNLAFLDIPIFEVKHLWNHLTEKYQQIILEKKVNFQGKDIKIGNLLEDQWISSIDLFPFKEILNGNIVEICKPETEEKESYFVHRRFLTLDSKRNISREDKERNDNEHGVDKLLNFAEDKPTILLCDEPGMGKSAALKFIQEKLKEKYLSRWIVFIDLKQYWRAFEVDNRITIDFSNCDIIKEFLADKILKIKDLEAQIFSQLFKFGQVIILMDGLDEICPSYKKFVFNLMIAIQAFSKNQLWISSRPHLQNDVENDLNPIMFKLKPFTEENRKEYFVKFFTAKKYGDQNIAEKIEDIDEFLKKLQLDKTNRFVSNPLIFKMLAECFDEDRSLKLSQTYLFSIYDQFAKKMIKRTMSAGHDAQESVANTVGDSSILKFYQKHAFKICFEGNKYAAKMIDLYFKHVATPSFEDSNRVGLMFSDGSGNYYFIHKTFAEFFVAKFFYEMLFLGKYQQDEPLKWICGLDVLFGIWKQTNDGYQVITTLLDNALFSFVDKKPLIEDPTAYQEHFSEKIEYNVLETLIESGHFNLVKTLLFFFHLQPRSVLLTKNKAGQNLIMRAVRIQSIDFNKQFFECVENILDKKEFKKLLSEQDHKDQNIFHFCRKNSDYPDVFNFLKEKVEALTDQNFLLSLLSQKDKNGLNFIENIKRRRIE